MEIPHIAQIIHPSRLALAGLLAHYESLAKKGGWPPFPDGQMLHPPLPPVNMPAAQGDPIPQGPMRDERIPALRMLLRIMGDYPGNALNETGADYYDADLQEAIKAFQRRHGLKADAIIGPLTQRALNIPVETRIRQIRATLQRMQALPLASDRYLTINIPDYSLHAYEAQQEALQMHVIVGATRSPTPRFDSLLTYISFNPSWGVPIRIAAEEFLSKIIEYPDFISDHHYKVYELRADGRYEIDPALVPWDTLDKDHFPYLLVQDPGEDNALGKIKFGLKNSSGIYMHDTPGKLLFKKDSRAFSHGCVRLENPRELAHFIFRPMPQYPPAVVDALYDSNEPKIVRVEALPVHFVYWTAWVDSQTGRPQFRADIYGLDR